MLQGLLGACEAHAAGRPARYVFLGDYIDRGSDSRGVIQLLMRRQQAQPGTHVCLRGNHEQMAIRAHESALALPLWLQNGGAATRCNYSGTNGRIEDSHLAWLRTLPFCYDDGLRFFVHAGIDLAKPLDEQSNEGMLWMREPFLSHCDEVDCGRFIVHGHTPLRTGTPDLRKRRIKSRHRCGHGWRPDGGGVRRRPSRAGRIPDGPRHEMNSRLLIRSPRRRGRAALAAQ